MGFDASYRTAGAGPRPGSRPPTQARQSKIFLRLRHVGIAEGGARVNN